MHRDPIGHPTTPTSHLVAYVWFASMYRQSPVGLKSLVNPADPTSAQRELILQQIAWNSVVGEKMSGVTGRKVAVASLGPCAGPCDERPLNLQHLRGLRLAHPAALRASVPPSFVGGRT
jgi:hypothetical protein